MVLAPVPPSLTLPLQREKEKGEREREREREREKRELSQSQELYIFFTEEALSDLMSDLIAEQVPLFFQFLPHHHFL